MKIRHKSINAIIVLGVMAFTYTCNPKNENKSSTYDDLFTEKQNIKFKRPVAGNKFFMSRYYATDSNDLFIGIEYKKGGDVIVYNFKTQKLIKKINNPTNLKIQDIHFDNLNEIYFISKYNSRIFKLNNNSIDTVLEITPKESLNSGMGIIVELAPSKTANLLFKDSVFLISNMTFSQKNMKKQKSIFAIDVRNNEIQIDSILGDIPDAMIKKDSCLFPYDVSVSYTINKDDDIILSYPVLNDVFIHKRNGRIKKVSLKSESINKLPDFISKNSIENEKLISKRFITLPAYLGIYFDEYRNLYYRTAKLESYYKDKEGLLNYDDFNFAIIVYDDNFKKIGEQIFNNKNFEANDLKVTKEGIMLKKQDGGSGYSKFTIFNLNKKYLK